MTKKRLIIIIVALLATIAMTIGVLAMWPSSPGVVRANFHRIENGMTMEEVEAIFEGEPGQQMITQGLAGFPVIPDNISAFYWKEEDGSFALVIFRDDRVSDKQWGNSEETVFEKIRRRLHLG
jgi:hypothetical protein